MSKAKEDKISIRGFKDGSSNWWVNDSHFYLNASEELIWGAGGKETAELREAIESFIKRNKKKFIARAPSVLEQEERVYSKVNFGKFSGLTTQGIVTQDSSYAKWLYKNTTDIKIKEELKELLNIK